jgi:hypothetical protein
MVRCTSSSERTHAHGTAISVVGVVIIAAVLLASPVAFADSVATYYVDISGSGAATIPPAGSPPISWSSGNVIQTGGTTVSETVGSPLPSPYFSVFAQAIAGPNDLGVYGNVAATGLTPQGSTSQVIVDAQLRDSLLLSNAPASGILVLYVDVNGSSLALVPQYPGFPDAFIELAGNVGGPGGCVNLDSLVGTTGGCGLLGEGINVLQLPYSSSNGIVPLNLFFEGVDTCDAQVGNLPGVVGSCIAASEYLDTARVASIVVENSSGTPVPGATATSLSGVSYTAAPEPGGLVLLGSGLLGIAGAVRPRPKRAL